MSIVQERQCFSQRFILDSRIQILYVYAYCDSPALSPNVNV
jgi:hypothetical protein